MYVASFECYIYAWEKVVTMVVYIDVYYEPFKH